MLERKRIAGVLHVRVLCGTCDNLIWVAESTFRFAWHPTARRMLRCTDCCPRHIPQTRGVLVRTADRQYHGGDYAG